MIGVEAPWDAPLMESRQQLRQHGEVAHALHALALVPFGDLGTDEGKRHAVELPSEHRIDVVHQLTRDAVLIGNQTQTQVRHRPFHRWPVQSGEARTDTE